MSYQRTGRPTGRPQIPKDLKRQTIALRLCPATVEAVDDLSLRCGCPSRTAFIERDVAQAVAAERHRLARGS